MKANELKPVKVVSPLYRLERKLNFKTLLIFSIVTVVLTFLGILMFLLMENIFGEIQHLENMGQEFKELMDQFLAEYKFDNYFTTNVGSTWGFVGIIYAAFLGCNLINSNLKNNSFETLYTLEYSRTKILWHKLARLAINVAIFNAVVAVLDFAMASIVKFNTLNFGNYVLYSLVLTMVCLMVGALSFGCACFAKRKYGTILSIVLAIGVYMLAQFPPMGAKFKAFEYLTPAYAIFAQVLSLGLANFNFVSLAIWMGISLCVCGFGVAYFNKSDII